VDTASAKSTEIAEPAPAAADEPSAESPPRAIPIEDALAAELYSQSGAAELELSKAEFAAVLCGIGLKYNFGCDAGVTATARQREEFCRALHIRDLALAHACALGRERAWQSFMAQYRHPLMQAAIALTRSSSLAEELADLLYSELFGVAQREGVRWSPLSTYVGRGSLFGWLRAMLTQKYANHCRRTHRETALDEVEVADPPRDPDPEPVTLLRLKAAVTSAMVTLSAEERFLLAAYYLDRRTLLELARVLRVHEATVSRKLKRVTDQIRKQLLKTLERGGMSRRAAQEALGADPRDLDLNLRKLLQTPGTSAFIQKEGQS
jgi:RNA polymerase sigma-70 factor (ECF subfamily)